MNYTIDHIPHDTPYKRRSALPVNATTITLHNTGNPTSTARNERSWLTNPINNRQASYHIVVDDHEAIECLPLNENGWHSGDGSGTKSGNRTSIGVEICESGDYAKALDNAIKLVARMLIERGWGVDRLRRHWDWSKKICPRLMYDEGTWAGWHTFVNRVQIAMDIQTVPKEDEDEMKMIEMIEKLQERVAKLETLIEAPVWFVKEFGSADLCGKIHDPRLTKEGWRVLAIGLRVNKTEEVRDNG